MKIKTADLIGPALDWAVAKCEGFNVEPWFKEKRGWLRDNRFSRDWSLAGPIIDRMMKGGVFFMENYDGYCHVAYSETEHDNAHGHGPTSLVAVCRCFVASRLGDEVEVPDELMK